MKKLRIIIFIFSILLLLGGCRTTSERRRSLKVEIKGITQEISYNETIDLKLKISGGLFQPVEIFWFVDGILVQEGSRKFSYTNNSDEKKWTHIAARIKKGSTHRNAFFFLGLNPLIIEDNLSLLEGVRETVHADIAGIGKTADFSWILNGVLQNVSTPEFEIPPLPEGQHELVLNVKEGEFQYSDTISVDVFKEAKNVILLIGDGMGYLHRKAVGWMTNGIGEDPFMNKLPIKGMLDTGLYGGDLTDSGAAATAMATGAKTNIGYIGFDPDQKSVESILELSRKQNMAAGLVTNVPIIHATPAAFASHVNSRFLYNDIASQMLLTGAELMFGGGEKYFQIMTDAGNYPGEGAREENDDLMSQLADLEYTYLSDQSDLESWNPVSYEGKVLGLFADEGFTRPYAPGLLDMTEKAVSFLSQDKDGFFLMVEGGQIDWASHDNLSIEMLDDVVEMDKVVQFCYDYASRNRDTLLIVTADHETGGLILSDREELGRNGEGPFVNEEGANLFLEWTRTNHTGVLVPVTAYGPGSEKLSGINQNTEVFYAMENALDTK